MCVFLGSNGELATGCCWWDTPPGPTLEWGELELEDMDIILRFSREGHLSKM